MQLILFSVKNAIQLTKKEAIAEVNARERPTRHLNQKNDSSVIFPSLHHHEGFFISSLCERCIYSCAELSSTSYSCSWCEEVKDCILLSLRV